MVLEEPNQKRAVLLVCEVKYNLIFILYRTVLTILGRFFIDPDQDFSIRIRILS